MKNDNKYKAKFLRYFEKDNRQALSISQTLNESYFINFSFIATTLLIFFTIANSLIGFWEAVWVNLIGIVLYLIGLITYKKSDSYYIPMAILMFNCSYILFGQHIILEFDAYHNMFFFPALAVFTFALIDKKHLLKIFLFGLCASAIISHFVVKYMGTTVKTLSSTEKDIYIVLCIIGSIYATFQIVSVLYAQRKLAYEKLDEANGKLIESNDRNRQLLAVLTHDIANPLSVMSTSVQLLSRNPAREEYFEEFNDRFARSEKNIIDIINNARKVLALEDGKIHVNIDRFNLRGLVDEALSNFEFKLETKDITIVKEGLDNHIFVLVDDVAFKTSVLSNIISNAIKFSENGSKISISAKIEKEYVLVEIKDSGMGMPKELMSQVFDPHAKTSRPGTCGEKGTGYGMPLAMSYLKLMGGSITCSSEPGAGTTFSFKLKKG